MIIGLNGFKGAGKDTVGKFIVANYKSFKRAAYADKLKESFAALFDITVEQIEMYKDDPNCYVSIGWKNKPDNLEGNVPDAMWSPMVEMLLRDALKRYGTESHRDVFWDAFWIDVLNMHLAIHQDYVITDVRFVNEMEDIKRAGGYVVRITRPGLKPDGHASEEEPPEHLIDAHIVNDDTFDWLFQQTAEVMSMLTLKEQHGS